MNLNELSRQFVSVTQLEWTRSQPCSAVRSVQFWRFVQYTP